MFLENTVDRKSGQGWIEVITGSMFSGKTEELIRRLRRARFARQKVEIFKPGMEKRYSDMKVVSHDEHSIHSTAVDSASNILLMTSQVEVVGIDEAQFFDMGLVDVCNRMAINGIRVVVAGLDMDFKGDPFGPIPHLMAVSEYVTKVHAICMRCGSLANYTHRLSDDEQLIMLGETDLYEPLCRGCFSREKRMK